MSNNDPIWNPYNVKTPGETEVAIGIILTLSVILAPLGIVLILHGYVRQYNYAKKDPERIFNSHNK